ncbi:MAG: hypothetical protein II505_01755 [Bacteroidaceae bacterium]|nr:hypothetical protein [Bacteroidaceae bacterium]MBQ2518683.1 hypothetical protein [Bacteroidaceae bacterium]
MKTLTRMENFLFRLGAVLMLCGLVARMFDAHAGLYVYGIGVLLFCLMQVRAEYLGRDTVIVRLRRQQLLACVFFLLSVACMSMQVLNYGILRRNEWVVALAIGCVLELYTAWRIPAELEKSKKS